MMKFKDKSIGEFFNVDRQYSLTKHQRAYKWGEKQVIDLLDDLFIEFDKYYQPNSEDSKYISKYGNYYLGDVIICDGKIEINSDVFSDNSYLIIDGQQRITTITLLLIYLYENLKKHLKENFRFLFKINDCYIYAQDNKEYYKFYSEERKECFDNISNNNIPENINKVSNISSRNLYTNYKIIENYFIENEIDKDKEKIYMFTEWIIDKVILLVLTEENYDKAYETFMKKNNRGLSLSPAEIIAADFIEKSGNNDKEVKEAIDSFFNNVKIKTTDSRFDEQTNAIISLMRTRLLQPGNLSEADLNKVHTDYSRISKDPHKWIYEYTSNNKFDYVKFVLEDLALFEKIYNKINSKKYEYIFYNNKLKRNSSINLLIYAVMNYNDNDKIIDKKINLMSKFIEYVTIIDIINPKKKYGHSSKDNEIVDLMVKIKGQNIDKIKEELNNYITNQYDEYIDKDGKKIVYNIENGLRNNTKLSIKNLRYILARISSELSYEHSNLKEEKIEFFERYINSNRYQLEHILPKTIEIESLSNFNDSEEYNYYVNNIGNLALLESSINQQIKNKPFKLKKEQYYNSNSSTIQCLLDNFYSKNTTTVNRIKEFKKKFTKLRSYERYETFDKELIEERAEMLIEIACKVWNRDEICK